MAGLRRRATYAADDFCAPAAVVAELPRRRARDYRDPLPRRRKALLRADGVLGIRELRPAPRDLVRQLARGDALLPAPPHPAMGAVGRRDGHARVRAAVFRAAGQEAEALHAGDDLLRALLHRRHLDPPVPRDLSPDP